MARCSSSLITVVVCLAIVCSAGAIALSAQNAFTGVSISVSKETAPPGGMAQVKVFITEPKPVSTGGGSYLFDAYDSVEGIALISELGYVGGIALVRGTQVDLSFTSPLATFGMDIDYPVLAVAGKIPPNAALGTKYPLVFDASTLQLFDPDGKLYPVEAKPGHLITAPGVSIHDVNPGSAFVPSGGTVTITGSSFQPSTEIKFSETKLSRVTYVNPHRIDVVVASGVEMHGMMIRASNKDGSKSTYFSYQRTRPLKLSVDEMMQPLPSKDPVLRFVVPLVPPDTATTAEIDVPAPAPFRTYGIAVQNVQTGPVLVTFTLVDATGVAIAGPTIELGSNLYLVQELSELFGSVPNGPCTVRISSTTPVQVIGVTADQTSGTASPILPR